MAIHAKKDSIISRFINLFDTPSTYTDQAGKFVRVNGDEDGLEFTTSSESMAHADLTDMPDVSGTNSDHDVRYVKSDGQSTDITNGTFDLTTSGVITGGKFEGVVRQVYFVKPTGTASTWTAAVSGVTAYTDNMMIVVIPPVKSTSNTTLNINGLGAKKVYYANTSQSGYFAANYTYFMVYDSTKDSGNGAFTGVHSYNSDTNAYMLRWVQAIKAAAAITAANVIVGTNAGYKHLKTGEAFDITLPILYAGSSISNGSTGTNNYLIYYFSVTTTQSITLTQYAPVYIKGNLSGKSFTPINTTPLTVTEPSSDDGYDYMLLGYAYSTSSMYILPHHPIFKYSNGVFGLRNDYLEWYNDGEAALVSLDAGDETNYVKASSTGIIYAGTAKPTRSFIIPAAGWFSSTTNGCSAGTQVEYGTNDVDLIHLDFDTTSDEYAQCTAILPSDYDSGTITAKFYWTAASGSGTVCWGLQGRAFTDSDAIDQSWGTAQTTTDTLITANDVHISSSTSAITLAGTPTPGKLLQLRMYRDVSEDSLAVDSRLIAVEIYYTAGSE